MGEQQNIEDKNSIVQPQTTPNKSTKLVIDPNIGITPTPAPRAPDISIPGWAAIRITANALEQDMALPNPIENEDWYYLTYELCLEGEEESLFATGLIPPGLYCTKVTLSHELLPGEYDAVMTVQPYRMNEALSPTNNVNYPLTLIVE